MCVQYSGWCICVHTNCEDFVCSVSAYNCVNVLKHSHCLSKLHSIQVA